MAKQTDYSKDETKETNDSDSDGTKCKTRTAKSVMARVMAKMLYSKPGNNILESYKDRVCASLPDDYNNTAMRLQTLIGASNHMIKWILTGDKSRVNQRIYQVVLVSVCFEPHFIKFCDIMEVLVVDSGCILELRKTLIEQLIKENHITIEEASQLTSTKLFTAPVPVIPTVNNSSDCVAQDVTTSQHMYALVNGLVMKLPNVSAVTDVTRTTNTADGAFTSDQLKQFQHISVRETLPPGIIKAPGAGEYSKNIPVTQNSTPDHEQSLKSVSDIDMTEKILQHASSKSEHALMPDTTHNQNTNIEGICSSPTTVHAKVNDNTDMEAIQEGVVLTAGEEIMLKSEASECATSLANTTNCGDTGDDDVTTKVDETLGYLKPLPSMAEQDLKIVDCSKSQLRAMPDEVKVDTDMLSKEVHDILETKDFAIVKAKYVEILSCFPENYETVLASLQNHLSDSQICDILSLTSGHTQKILNFLILQLTNKEDLLDFCDHLERIQEVSPSLKVIVEQLRKETIEMIQAAPNPQRSPSTVEKTEAAAVIPVAPPARPPHKYLPYHPALLVIPKETEPFDSCLLPNDCGELAAVKKCYTLLIKNLPANHLTSLVRLQDVAVIPEEIVDSIVPSPSAEIGNKMIINYLIGLVHTEEHVITFCDFAERMLGEFDKCICVLNLRNTIKIIMDLKENDVHAPITDSTHSVTGLSDTKSLGSTENAVVSCEVVEVDDKNVATTYFGGTSINSIIKLTKNSDHGPPYLHKSGIMTGFKQAVIIVTDGDRYEETIKAIPLEIPSESSTDENGAPIPYLRKDVDLVKSYFRKDINKELSFTLYDGPDVQRSRNFYLECLEVLFKECNTAGVTIYYTGYAEEGTGNWCFKDGIISFQDIFTLYKEYCKGKVLCIFTDCCYSGQWVLDCAKSLDEMGIGACGHKAREEGILLKIFTSCYPNQKAALDCYITKEGMYLNEEDNSIWLYYNKKVSDTQTTHGYDFTRISCLQLEGPSAPCQYPDIPANCSWKWEDLVSIESEKRPSSLIYTVRGTDRGRKAWHLVLVERELREDFRKKVSTGTIDVAKYGHVIKSGWGEDPPDDILDKIKKYSPN